MRIPHRTAERGKRMAESRRADRRQQKTRDAIFQALARLLKKKNFSSITVQEIIDEANVGRTTFYAHFETKNHLLKAMCESIFDHVLSEHLQKEETHDFSLGSGSIPELLEHVLFHLQDEKEEILDILLTDSADLFLRYFSDNVRVLLEHNRQLLPRLPESVPGDYQLQMLTSGFVETVRWWAGNRMQYTPQQVAAFYTRIYLPGTKE